MKFLEIVATVVIAFCLTISVPMVKKRFDKMQDIKRFDQIEKILKKGEIKL